MSGDLGDGTFDLTFTKACYWSKRDWLTASIEDFIAPLEEAGLKVIQVGSAHLRVVGTQAQIYDCLSKLSERK